MNRNKIFVLFAKFSKTFLSDFLICLIIFENFYVTWIELSIQILSILLRLYIATTNSNALKS